MNFYIITAADKLVFSDVEFATRTQNQIDRYNNKLDALQRFLDNHPKLLQRKNPDPAKLAELAIREQAVAAEVVDKFVLRELKPDGTNKKIVLLDPVYVGQWDGLTPFVTTLVGTFPIEGIPFVGWPQTDIQPDDPPTPTQEQLDAAVAVAAAQDQWRITAQTQMQLGDQIYYAWIAANPYPA
jgi:hypothetical protein